MLEPKSPSNVTVTEEEDPNIRDICQEDQDEED